LDSDGTKYAGSRFDHSAQVIESLMNTKSSECSDAERVSTDD